jgi:uncharacterized protein DUF1552
MIHKTLSRRTLLKGLGVSIALPFLEAMTPALSLAGGAVRRRQYPRRMAFVYVPNGINMRAWTPEGLGRDFELTPVLSPLQRVRDDIVVMSGLTCDKARPNGDGPGDHARAMAAFLTGCQARKTHGADIRVGVSLDQLAAQAVGNQTRFPSLEIGCEGGRTVGNCDSGYSCAYSSTISWRTETTPLPKEVNPRALFDRLFASQLRGESLQSQARRQRYNQSILDFVTDDASALRGRLGGNDQRRLDEYMSSIRDVERRVVAPVVEEGETPPVVRPMGVPSDYGEHLRVMADLLALAFQGDLTRISTFVFANDGSNRSYRPIGISEGHHDISHHGRNAEKLAKLRRINHFHIKAFAHLIERLKATPEGEGTLLDNCMIVYGAAIGDGNRHNHDDLPVLLAGKGGGTIATGRHVRYPRETPLTNLYLSMLDRMGVRANAFGDSTGRLESLT